MKISNFGLWISNCRSRISDVGFRIANCALRISKFEIRNSKSEIRLVPLAATVTVLLSRCGRTIFRRYQVETWEAKEINGKQQDDQKGCPARPEGAKPPAFAKASAGRPERTPVREEAERLKTPLAVFFSIILLSGCGPTGVTLLKPSNLVNYQYVTCYPHGEDPSVVKKCIEYYEKRGFVRQDQINMLQM